MGTSLVEHDQQSLWVALLESYFDRASRNMKAFVAAALRIRSTAMRDVLVFGAVNCETSSAALKDLVLKSDWDFPNSVKDPGVLAELGRLIILQNVCDDDIAFGTRLIEVAQSLTVDTLLPRHIRTTLIQVYISAGATEDAKEILELSPDPTSEGFDHFAAELDNPFLFRRENNFASWLSAFNDVFEQYQVAKVDLRSDASLTPFDRLAVAEILPPTGNAPDSPLVSVVLTAYRPDENRILSSVRSILEQTWQNLELIIVDDCSGPEFDHIFAKLASIDNRVSIIKAPKNQGTYVARNIGFDAARGHFITGQDDDDWSHPQRLAYQIDYMLKHPGAAGCRVRAVRCDENLGRVRVGDSWLGQNASSLLIRRDGFNQVGGFIQARKAADTEYYYRLAAVTGGPVAELKEPLSVIRVLDDSLSRGDFARGWRHSSRRAFRSSYEFWHRTSNLQDLKLAEGVLPKVKIPRRFEVEQKSKDLEIDVVFLGDWEKRSVGQRAMLQKIRALRGSGLRVGILNMDTDWFSVRKPQNSLIDEIQELINEGLVEEVLYDETLVVRLMVLHDPVLLQFPPHEVSSLRIQRMAVVANGAPNSIKGDLLAYLPAVCHQNAVEYFGVVPRWAPQDTYMREFLLKHLSQKTLAQRDDPGIIDVDQRCRKRLWYRSTFPVVGSYVSGSDENLLSDIQRVLAALKAGSGAIDFRVLGRFDRRVANYLKKAVRSALGVYDLDQHRPGHLLRSLDYLIYVDVSDQPARADSQILEAIASGVIVILPPRYRSIYGDAAIYCKVEKAHNLISYFHSDFRIYSESQNKCAEALHSNFSYHAYQSRIVGMLSTTAD